MPSSSSSVRSAGAPSAYTDAGPPERIRPLRRAPRDLLERDMVRQQLGEHAALAHAARDQLRVLAAEVEDQHLVGGGPGIRDCAPSVGGRHATARRRARSLRD